MMPTEAAAQLSVQDIALMREIVRWRRNHGWLWHPFAFASRWVESATGRAVFYNNGPCGVEFACTTDYHRNAPRAWIAADSLTQAVDLLVAFGYLPQRFSSAYRDGWEASAIWLMADPKAPQYRAMFHDPDNISFPAHEAAW